ncbi:MAG: hypothetical protein ACTS7E_02405 [Arsenophonus sp. NC-CH8-MAG3]
MSLIVTVFARANYVNTGIGDVEIKMPKIKIGDYSENEYVSKTSCCTLSKAYKNGEELLSWLCTYEINPPMIL